MQDESYTLTELATATGIEERTIRSYIERGLLPGAQTRGRAASYSPEHLSKLQVIKALRCARPNSTLNEIRIALEQLAPQQIQALADGSITAARTAVDASWELDADDSQDLAAGEESEASETIDWERSAPKLTGAERLVCLLREVTGFRPSARTSRIEAWHRISVTPDVELSVRADFDASQLAAFRQLADLLRHLFQHTDALVRKGEE